MMRDARLWLGEDPFECAMEMDEPKEETVEDILREMSDEELAYLFTAILGEIQHRINEEDEDESEDEDEDEEEDDDWNEDEWDLEEDDDEEEEDEDDDDDYYVSCSPLWGCGTFLEE